MENQIKAVIFDGDGMVINGEMFYLDLVRNFGSKAEVFNPFYANEFQLCLVGKADLKDELKKYLEALGYDSHVDEFIKHWFRSEHSVDEGIVNYIKELRDKGIRCYLATNQEKYRSAYMREEMDFDNLFDGIFFSCELGYIKPQQEFYHAVSERLEKDGIKKDEVIFWDDREKNISETENYGFKAALYRNFGNFLEVMSSYGI